MDGDPQLWGSMPGAPVSCVVQIDPPLRKTLGRVRIDVFCVNRRDPMKLMLEDMPADRMLTGIGYIMPLMVKMSYVNTGQLRRHFWQVYRTLVLAGWKVTITGCGAEKGHRKA